MSTTLTKKQQKLAAFRNKQKAKKSGPGAKDVDQPDVPEQDLMDDDEDAAEDAVVVSQPSEKEKAKDKVDEGVAVEDEEEEPKKVDKGKKKKTAWDDEEEDGEKKRTKKDVKQRFILFVGNLSFKTTKEEIQEHFAPTLGSTPSVRLLTTKPTPQNPKPKSRGIAFLELPTSAAMQLALKLHHSNLKGRTINVELTAGGGGQSESRKRKIEERNNRVGAQRERKAEKEQEEAGEGVEGEEQGDGGEEKKDGKTKTRGGRRVKSKTKPTDGSAPPAKKPRSDPSDPNAPLSGWASRQAGTVSASPSFNSSRPPRRDFNNNNRRHQNGGGAAGGKFQKKKWTPTGANAQPVG
ncbi:hypothetical protein L486_07513 [Kwoniella mangroviensis CBS 10435]|uniref:Nucleolar protein 12 n=1 Tax=Kwoniella mangroviensis CBS 10435 TaxID=1331196 RepID=A0A1B9IGN9_9TREE|nr:hypothetical protein L486_07513 [Kwoniella mangroviensis CBS 10435]